MPNALSLRPSSPLPGHRGLFGRLLQAMPSQCAICGEWPTRLICPACQAQHIQPGPRCLQCALRLADAQRLSKPIPGQPWRCGDCLLHPPPWQLALAAVDYAAPWPALIAAFKFRGELGMARNLAQLMWQVSGAVQCIDSADGVVPIPLTRQTLLRRGYNQTALLAQQLAPRTLRHALLRVKEHTPQHRLTRHERLTSLRGAFVVAPGTALAGQRLLLIDDVMTTGATARAASQCLLDAGAARVDVLVLARTGPYAHADRRPPA